MPAPTRTLIKEIWYRISARLFRELFRARIHNICVFRKSRNNYYDKEYQLICSTFIQSFLCNISFQNDSACDKFIMLLI